MFPIGSILLAEGTSLTYYNTSKDVRDVFDQFFETPSSYYQETTIENPNVYEEGVYNCICFDIPESFGEINSFVYSRSLDDSY